jgi:hypothetical protein
MRIHLRVNEIDARLLRAARAPAAVPDPVAGGDLRSNVLELDAAPVGQRSVARVASELPTEDAPNAAPRRPEDVRTNLPWSIGCREEQLATLINGVANNRDR